MAKKPTSPEEIQEYEERRRVEQRAEREKRLRERAQRGGLWSRRDFFWTAQLGRFRADFAREPARLCPLGLPSGALRSAVNL